MGNSIISNPYQARYAKACFRCKSLIYSSKFIEICPKCKKRFCNGCFSKFHNHPKKEDLEEVRQQLEVPSLVTPSSTESLISDETLETPEKAKPVREEVNEDKIPTPEVPQVEVKKLISKEEPEKAKKLFQNGLDLFYKAKFDESLAKLEECNRVSVSTELKAKSKLWSFRILQLRLPSEQTHKILEEVGNIADEIENETVQDSIGSELDYCVGLLLTRKSQYRLGLAKFQDSLDISELTSGVDEFKLQIDCHIGIGNILFKQEKYRQNTQHCERVLQILEYIPKQNHFHYSKSLVHHQLGRLKYCSHFNKSAIEHFEKSLAIQDEQRVYSSKGNSLLQIGIIRLRENKNQKALEFFGRAMGFFKQQGNLSGMATVLENTAKVCDREGDLEKAKSLVEESLKLRKKLGDVEEIASSLLFLGEINSRMSNNDETKRCYEESLELFKKVNLHRRVVECMNKLGCMEREVGNFDIALSYFSLCGEKCQKFSQNFLSIKAKIHYEIGRTYEYKKCYDESLSHFKKALNLFLDLKLNFEIGMSYFGIGECNERLKRIKNAVDNYKFGIERFRKCEERGKFWVNFISHKVEVLETQTECNFLSNLRDILRGKKIENFEIVKKIGKTKEKSLPFMTNSEMCAIKIKDQFPERELALKIIQFRILSETSSVEGEKEILSMNQSPIIHKNLYSVFHHFSTRSKESTSVEWPTLQRGVVYMVLPMYTMNLQQKINRSQFPINDFKFLWYLQEILDGVVALFESGIVHCQLKKENVVITERENVFLIGFDKIKQFDDGTSFRIKKEEPMDLDNGVRSLPLEIFLTKVGEFYDYSKVDIFSVGLLAYTMLSKKSPFGDSSAQNRSMKNYVELPNTISEDLRLLVRGMLHIDKNQRLSCLEAFDRCKSLLSEKLNDLEEKKQIEMKKV